MTGLVFKRLLILSKAQKTARAVSLKPGVNLLTGQNDVGKSTLIKSLYHSIGADVPQMDNSRWKRAQPVYCAHVSLGDEEYYIVRDGKYFGVFDKDKKFVSRHQGVATERGVAQFLCKKLNFRIELEKAADSTLGLAGPSFYFLPFYIDQDAGWSTSWTSFNGLQQFRTYRKSMIEYHLGVRPQSYYDAKKRELELNDQLLVLKRERDTLDTVRTSYRQRKAIQQVDLDPAAFRAEIEELVDRFNEIYSRQQEVLHKLKEVRNERNAIDTDLHILRRAIAELNADYEYAEAPETPDCINCPTCGTGISNSFVERFGILDDIDYCYMLVDQRKKVRMEVQERLNQVEELFAEVSSDLSKVDDLLRRKKQNVTFSELVTSEGIKELLSSINEDIGQIQGAETQIEERVRELADDLKIDGKQKKQITAFYQARMKEFLNLLNVHVLDESDYNRLDQVIRNNALGSDLPRSLLAQYFAFLRTMAEFNPFVLCPMVIDSPQQQEQDETNVDAIFAFIFNQVLPGQQLVLGTISVSQVSSEIIPADAHRVELTDKFALLKPDEYQAVFNDVNPLHEMTLSSD